MESSSNADYDYNPLLTRVQQLKFTLKNLSDGNDVSQISDTYRNLYLLSEDAWKCERNTSDQTPFLMDSQQHLEQYASIIDRMDDSGMNNFAEAAMALCKYHKNESMKWRTSLSVENIINMASSQSSSSVREEQVPPVPEEEDCIITLKSTNSVAPPSADNNLQSLFVKTSDSSGQGILTSSLHPLSLSNGDPTGRARTLTSQSASDPRQFCAKYRLQEQTPNDKASFFQQMGNTGDKRKVFSTVDCSMEKASQNNGAFGCGIFQSCPSSKEKKQQVEKLEVNAYEVGGPYANFGQKRKIQPQQSAYNKSSWQNKGAWTKHAGKQSSDDDWDDDNASKPTPFRTAKQQYDINQQKKFGNAGERSYISGNTYGAVKKSLGTRRGPASKFVPPMMNRDADGNCEPLSAREPDQIQSYHDQEEVKDERLKGIDQKMIELINNEIMDHGAHITWSDIAGLEFAKKTIKEIVVWPMLRPDIFTGLRGPPKGLLLFGPPGTGKTLIGKCIASQSKSTFFCISASSLTSKWVGEGEKMVRALFAVARCHQPAVVFIDEIDSLLSQRSDTEHESSRRIKTEFLIQLDGASTESEDRILVIGATNRPQEIDEAARRRFVKRLLIPLPDIVARQQILTNLMAQQNCKVSEAEIKTICDKTDGYSGADMTNLCREAALGPIRSIPLEQMETINPDQVRAISFTDFEDALLQVRASVSAKDLDLYTEWNKTYGSFGH